MNPDGADAPWERRSVWRLMGLRFERLPVAFGRFVRTHRIERRLRPVQAEQDELDSRLRIIRFATGIALMALLVLAGLLLSGAHAGDAPAHQSLSHAGKCASP